MHYPPFRDKNTLQAKKQIMTVYGNSRIAVEPSIVNIQLGVINEDTELTKAQQKNASLIQQIKAALLNQGISDKNIQTADYSIYPQYDYIDSIQKFRGYQVTHLLSIATENINQIGNIIDAAVKSGANRISNVQFSIKNKEFHYNNAIKIALNNAMIKAKTIANELKVHLDSVPFQILEQSIEPPAPINYKSFTSSGLVAGISTTIEPGQLYLEAKLEVKFHYYM